MYPRARANYFFPDTNFCERWCCALFVERVLFDQAVPFTKLKFTQKNMYSFLYNQCNLFVCIITIQVYGCDRFSVPSKNIL